MHALLFTAGKGGEPPVRKVRGAGVGERLCDDVGIVGAGLSLPGRLIGNPAQGDDVTYAQALLGDGRLLDKGQQLCPVASMHCGQIIAFEGNSARRRNEADEG